MVSGRQLTIFVPRALGAASEHAAPKANLLILHDGQNLFDGERSYIQGETWRVAETIEALMAAGELPPTVVVGIDHGGDRRLREFGHGAATYGRFVVRDVLPYVRAHYPVSTAREHTWMGGSSMGGLVTLQIATIFPDVFGRLFVFSPSVWWNRRSVLRTIRRPGMLAGLFSRSRGLNNDADIWVSIGLHEGDEAVDDARRLRDVILAMHGGDPSHLRYREFADGTHSEKSWAEQLPIALRAKSYSP